MHRYPLAAQSIPHFMIWECVTTHWQCIPFENAVSHYLLGGLEHVLFSIWECITTSHYLLGGLEHVLFSTVGYGLKHLETTNQLAQHSIPGDLFSHHSRAPFHPKWLIWSGVVSPNVSTTDGFGSKSWHQCPAKMTSLLEGKPFGWSLLSWSSLIIHHTHIGYKKSPKQPASHIVSIQRALCPRRCRDGTLPTCQAGSGRTSRPGTWKSMARFWRKETKLGWFWGTCHLKSKLSTATTY